MGGETPAALYAVVSGYPRKTIGGASAAPPMYGFSEQKRPL